MGVTLPSGFEREKFDHASLMAMEDDSCVRMPRCTDVPSHTGSAGRGSISPMSPYAPISVYSLYPRTSQ